MLDDGLGVRSWFGNLRTYRVPISRIRRRDFSGMIELTNSMAGEMLNSVACWVHWVCWLGDRRGRVYKMETRGEGIKGDGSTCRGRRRW